MADYEVLGIDTSHWKDGPGGEPLPDFAAGADFYAFGLPKITDGYKYGLGRPGLEDYEDPEFQHARRSLAELGKPWGVFHFFESGKDPKKQADAIASALDRAGDKPDLPIYINLESNPGGLTIAQMRNDLEKCVSRTELLTSCQVDFYSSYSKWGRFVANPINGASDLVRDGDKPRGLWVANYGVVYPLIPWDWSQRFGPAAWDIWQPGTIQLAGFKGNVDYDLFNGTAEEFESRFGIGVEPIPEPPPPPGPPAEPERVRIFGLLQGETLRLRANVWGEIIAATWNGCEFEVMAQAKDSLDRTWFQLGPSIWVAGWYCSGIEIT